MKAQILTSILLAGSLSACQTRKNTIFLEQAWNRADAKNACVIYKRNHNTACIKTPEQMTTESRLRFVSAVLQSPACKYVTIRYTPVGEEDMKDYLGGWSLTFDVGIDVRDIDYYKSVWQMLDNKTKKRFEKLTGNRELSAAQTTTWIFLAAPAPSLQAGVRRSNLIKPEQDSFDDGCLRAYPGVEYRLDCDE